MSFLRRSHKFRDALYRESVGQVSMAGAGGAKFEHYDLVYSGGMMAALAIDLEIMDGTDGRQRLDDVMPAVFERYGPDRRHELAPATLTGLIEGETGVDVSALMDCCVTGTELIRTDELRRRPGEML